MADRRVTSADVRALKAAHASAATSTATARAQLEEARKLVERLQLEADAAQQEHDRAVASSRAQGKARVTGGAIPIQQPATATSSAQVSSSNKQPVEALRQLDTNDQIAHNPWTSRLEQHRHGVSFAVRLSARPLTVAARGTIEVTWDCACPHASHANDDSYTGPAVVPGSDDWVGVYPAGSPTDFLELQGGHRAIQYVDGKRGGTVKITMPSIPGKYVLRYVYEGGLMVTESAPIAVVEASSPGTNGSGSGASMKEAASNRSGTGGPKQASQVGSAPSDAPAVPASAPSSSASTARQPSSAHSLVGPEVEDGSVVEPGSPARMVAMPSAVSSPANKTASPPSIQPPYLLEKLSRISTYTLMIPLPWWMRVAGKGNGAGTGGGNTSPGSAAQPMLYLPADWSPGVRILGDSAAALAAGETPGVEVVFTLPSVPGAGAATGTAAAGASVSAYDASEAPVAAIMASLPSDGSPSTASTAGSTAQAGAGATPGLSTLPTQLYRLRLSLPHRVETAKCGIKVYADHCALRLPMFYGGSAVPDRPASLVTPDETLSLRRQGRRMCCRLCGSMIIREHVAETGSAAGAASTAVIPAGSVAPLGAGKAPRHPWGMRAYLLPSEHWLEWADYWMCHETQANVYIPDTDFGAKRGVLLVGETHIAVHPADVRSDSVAIEPVEEGSAAAVAAQGGGTGQRRRQAHGHGDGHDDHDDDEDEGRMGPATQRCVVYCQRCLVPLGTTSYAPRPGAQPGVPPSLESSASWPDSLAPEVDLVLTLYKDRLSVPLDAEPSPSAVPLGPVFGAGAGPAGQTVIAEAPSMAIRNALSHYGVSSRVATLLLASAQSHSQYRFIIAGQDEYEEQFGAATKQLRLEADIAGIGDGRDEARQHHHHDGPGDHGHGHVHRPADGQEMEFQARGTALCRAARLCIVLVNWNASVRAQPRAVGSDLPNGAAASPSAGPQLQAPVRPFCTGKDMPVLQLQYVELDGSGQDGSGLQQEGAVRRWAFGDPTDHDHDHDDEDEDTLLSPEPVVLLPEELEEVLDVIRASTALRPTSARSLGGLRPAGAGPSGGAAVSSSTPLAVLPPFQLGYLPFLAGLPTDT